MENLKKKIFFGARTWINLISFSSNAALRTECFPGTFEGSTGRDDNGGTPWEAHMKKHACAFSLPPPPPPSLSADDGASTHVPLTAFWRVRRNIWRALLFRMRPAESFSWEGGFNWFGNDLGDGFWEWMFYGKSQSLRIGTVNEGDGILWGWNLNVWNLGRGNVVLFIWVWFVVEGLEKFLIPWIGM